MAVGDTVYVTVDRFEGHLAVLMLEDRDSVGIPDGQQLTLPKKLLPKGAGEGSVLVLELATETAVTEAREQTARKLLEDILNGK